jgi:hypothetical protein
MAKIGERERALRAARAEQLKMDRPLSLVDRERRIDSAIERGRRAFAEIGEELKVIRDEQLYLATHESFDEYCRERWHFTRSTADRLISGYDVIASLTPIGVTDIKESQARELGKIPPDNRAEVFQEASERTNGKPTAKAIREVVAERAEPSTNGAHPEPEDDAPDPVAEWERAEKEVERLEELLAMLKTSDVAKELTALSGKYGQLEGRLRQEMTTRSEAEKEARYAKGELARIRKALHVERDRDILPAIEALR